MTPSVTANPICEMQLDMKYISSGTVYNLSYNDTDLDKIKEGIRNEIKDFIL